MNDSKMDHLPFQPEPIEALRARLPQAVAELINPRAILLQEALPPGMLRKHVFDFECGYRMIVSVDPLGLGPLVSYHVSAAPFTVSGEDKDTTVQMCLALLEQI